MRIPFNYVCYWRLNGRNRNNFIVFGCVFFNSKKMKSEQNKDSIEFYTYNGTLDEMIGKVYTSMVPPVGSYINMIGKRWQVTRVTYVLDTNYDADCDKFYPIMRANIEIVPF